MLEGKPTGYFVLSEGDAEVRMNARFVTDGIEQNNPFLLLISNCHPTHVLPPDGLWRTVPQGTWPTCAWPLVLKAGLNSYKSFEEATGKVDAYALRHEDGLVVEYAGGRRVRSFGIDGGIITFIDWGGAESRLKASRAEAVAGTAFENRS